MPGIITSIQEQAKDARRVNIYLDGDFAVGVSKLLAVDLEVGQHLDDPAIGQLQFRDEKAKRVQQAMRLIQRRPRSRKELEDYYRRKGLDDALRDFVLEHLIELGLVNDWDFADEWIENRQAFRPRGARALRYELRKKGIAAHIIDEALEGFDEEAAALATSKIAWRRYKHLSEREYKRKALPYMARRGFSYAISANAIKKIRKERMGEENESEDST